MLFVLSTLGATPPLPDYNWLVFPWLGATGLYLLAVAPPRRSPSADGARWPATNWRLLAGVVGITLAALVLRVWQIHAIPPTLGGDEGSQGLEAMRVLEGEVRNPFSTGWLGVPTMSFYFNALTIGPLGNTIAALRLPWAVVGTATVLVMFFLVKRLVGVPLALMTAALLATYHYHIHFSRLGSNQVADALFVALALLYCYRGYDRRSTLDWALCGVVIGLAQYFYAGARFTAVVIVATTVFLALRDNVRFWRTQRDGVLVMLGAALMVAAPMIQYALRFPDDYNARINEVGIIQSGWLEREQEILNTGALPILFDQFRRAALAFNFYPDRTVWYGNPEPLFGFAAAALFGLGYGYGVLNLLDRRLFPLVAWWGGAMIMGGMLTESPPSSQRLITMAAPAVFFVALAVFRVGQVILHSLGAHNPRLLQLSVAVVIVALSLTSIRWYFVEYTPLRVYGNYNAVVATSLGKYARDELDPNWRIYFFGPPRMYVTFGSIPYIAPEVEGVDFVEPLDAPLDRNQIPPDKHAVFVFLPERLGELDLVRETFPDGELEQIAPPPPYTDQTLYVVYRVPLAQIVQ